MADQEVLKLKSLQEMVTAGGRLSQLLGYPKSVGQIYGLLFFSHQPKSLDDIAGQLGMSKASVSNGVRQLESLGLVTQVWVPGDRKEYLEAVGEVSALLRAGYSDFLEPRVGSSKRRIEEIGRLLEKEQESGELSREEYEFANERFERLRTIQSRFEKLLPVLKKLA